jgi:hypothetical protein
MIDYCDASVTRSQLGRLTKGRAQQARHLSAVVVWFNPRYTGIPEWDGMAGRVYRQIKDNRFDRYSRNPDGRTIMNPAYDESLHWPSVVAACLTFENHHDALAFYMTNSTNFLAVDLLDERGGLAKAT